MGLPATIALAAALLVAGGAFDLASLYVPAIALLLLGCGAGAWVWLATRGVRVERLPGAKTVVEGEEYPAQIRVGGGLLGPRGELVDPLAEHPLRLRPRGLGLHAGREPVTIDEPLRFRRRGRTTLAPPKLIVRDPLGLRTREVTGDGGGQVLVLPRVEPVVAASGRSGDDGGAAGRGAREGAGLGLGAATGVEIDGLRPYRRGSPASRIHWPAVARHGELIERRLASGSVDAALVVLDATRPEDGEALDRAVRATASLAVHLARSGGCTLLVSGSARPIRIDPGLRAWDRAHARLALVEAGGALPAGVRGAAAPTTFWVSASRGRAPRGLGRGSFLVTAVPPPGFRAAFTVAGCAGAPVSARRVAPAPRRSAA